MPSTPALQFIGLAKKRLAAIRRDVPKLTELGEKMAAPLLEGGDLFPQPVAKFWPSEFSYRAGGMMGLRHTTPSKPKDVAYFAIPDPRRWKPAEDKTLQQLLASKAQLFAIGRPDEVKGLDLKRFAGFTGGSEANAGLYSLPPFTPLCPLRPFEQIVRGWLTGGEMICACTRGGKMPILWMSVWLEGALVRNGAFTTHNNRNEPWSTPLFQPDWYVPPLPKGYAAGEFMRELDKIIARLEKQHAALAKAGEWMAQAFKARKKIWTILVGHSYPEILERPEGSQHPLEWGASNSNLSTAVPERFGPGDVALHLGYAPVDVAKVARILKRGIRFIYTSPYGRPAELKDHKNLIWLDLPWRPADATVDIPGYSVRMMPMSSSAETVALFAMLSEMGERMKWNHR
ncbi:MAG TPA: hypothetical protein VGP72_21055 [Planctomycetota bacterium]